MPIHTLRPSPSDSAITAHTLQDIAGWKPPESGRYSLALALGQLEPCDLGNAEYRALVKYERVPVHSDFHDAETSRELMAALKGELPLRIAT